MNSSTLYGLVSQHQQVALTEVSIHAHLDHHLHRVTVNQKYQNQEKNPIEATYLFPLEHGSAIHKMQIKVGDRVIDGQIKEREDAFEAYDDALLEGHGAVLLDQERSNVFTASVGNLEPQEEVEIEISYVALPSYEESGVRLLIPTVVAPRYTPVSKSNEVGMSDEERFNGPRFADVPYSLRLTVDVSSPRKIMSLDSPSHPIRTQFTSQGARISLSHETTSLDRDFILAVEYENEDQPFTWVSPSLQEDDQALYVMSTFVPDFEFKAQHAEILFLVDCSGSMWGSSIEEAKKALGLCLRSIQEGSFFNIMCFGSTYESLWPRAKAYSQQSLKEAQKYVDQIDANLGGTDLYEPLQDLMDQPLIDNLSRQILLLTDGQVSNEAEVVGLCRKHAEQARIFSFGIGDGVSESLVSDMAKVTRGKVELIHSNERIEPKVLRTFKRVYQPLLKDLKVNWHKINAEMACSTLPTLYCGDRYTILARLPAGQNLEEASVVIECETQSWTLPLTLDLDAPFLSTLWAATRIQDLETQLGQVRGSLQNRRRKDPSSKVKQELLDLSLQYQLLSSQASFVAIEEREDHKKTTQVPQLRQIPLAHLHSRQNAHHRLSRSLSYAATNQSSSFGGAAGFYSSPSASSSESNSTAYFMTTQTISMKPTKREMKSTHPLPALPLPPLGASAPSSPVLASSPAPASFPAPSPAPSSSSPKRRSMTKKRKSPESHLRSNQSFSAPSYSAPSAPSAPSSFEPPLSSPTPSTSKDPLDDLFDLLLTQQANGTFLYSHALKRYFDHPSLSQVFDSNLKDDQVYVTVFILNLLTTLYFNQMDLWEGASVKANRFLQNLNSQRVEQARQRLLPSS